MDKREMSVSRYSDFKIPSLILVFALIKFAIHLYTNTFAGYGIFRDELYYYACSLRPHWGYVDQPPLCVWILKLATWAFGKSLFAMRTMSALFGSLAIIPFGLAVKSLGGKKTAVCIACVAFITSPIYLAQSSYYSMNSIDFLLWNTLIYLLIKLKQTQTPKIWIWIGIVLGLSLLNKIGIIWFGTGLFISLLLTDERHWLATRWPYIAAIIAFVFFLPYVLWNASHDWAMLEFMESARNKYRSETPLSFLTGQILINNPLNILVWIPGIIYFIYLDKARKALGLFIIFLTVISILLINVHSKPEYLAPIFGVLFVGGALAIEKWSAGRKWIAFTIIAFQLSGLVLVPLAIPILPVKSYVNFSEQLGIAPSTPEGHQLAELPQFYADMFGWENQAQSIAKVYHGLSEQDQKQCALYGDNYGRAGAVDYFADKYDLPHSIGRHNNYWIWGPGNYDGKLLILLSNDIGDKKEYFAEVQEMGTVYSKYAIPYENNLKIYLCRDLQIPVDEMWLKVKSYN